MLAQKKQASSSCSASLRAGMSLPSVNFWYTRPADWFTAFGVHSVGSRVCAVDLILTPLN